MDISDGIFGVKYESARTYVSDKYERQEESLESKRAIRRINQEDSSENLGNTFHFIDYFPNQ